MTKYYKVADIVFDITATCTAWDEIEWHFSPFATDDRDSVLSVSIAPGIVDTSELALFYSDSPQVEGDIEMHVFKDAQGMTFELKLAPSDPPTCWIRIDNDCRSASITVDEHNQQVPHWRHVSALVAALQLSYILASEPYQTLMGHASTVVYDGRAYLFIAKSGTGKSTHCRLWLEHVPGSSQLNDDHPIVRVWPGGRVIAYGSPWSGKTHCYKDQSYPVGAIVRISRAPANAIQRQSPVLAYASIATSFSGFKWHRQYADLRHQTLEKIVSSVPCYVLHCLPDREAAILCSQTVTNSR